MTEPRRVLVVAPTPFFGDRGCHVRILEEARALHPLGYETEIVTYPAGNDPPGLSVTRARRLPGIAPSALGPSWNRPLLDLLLTTRALGRLRRWRPHLIHAHLHEGVGIGAVLRRWSGVPLIADLQGSLTEELVDHGVFRREGLAASVVRRVEAWLGRQPDVTLVSSSASLPRPEERAPSQHVRLLPDAVDLQRFGPRPRRKDLVERFGLAGKKVVVFLGVLTPYQGVDALIELVPEVSAAVPDVHFLVMGYPNEERYRALVAERGLERWVTLPGRVPYDEAADWLALGDVAVTLKQSLTEANGKVLNYMACALPVVATDTLVNRELLGPEGVYAPVGDRQGAVRALLGQLQSPECARSRGAALRVRAEQEFSWVALGRRLADVYQTVLDASPGHTRAVPAS